MVCTGSYSYSDSFGSYSYAFAADDVPYSYSDSFGADGDAIAGQERSETEHVETDDNGHP